MLKQLTTVQVWVNDQDEALAFYTDKLGLELRDDVTMPELGNFRWLTVGVPGQDIAIVLMAVPGPPVFDEETRDQIKALVSASNTGGPGTAIRVRATSGCPGTPTVSQRKFPSSGMVTSSRSSRPSLSV